MLRPELNYHNELHFSRSPEASHAQDNVTYLCFDDFENIQQANPFIVNSYDFQKGFYHGDFTFDSPLNGEVITGTSEVYGRHKITSALLEVVSTQHSTSVLDIGSGTLDISRAIPEEFRSSIRMYNSDISGPWTTIDGQSALERGVASLLAESNNSHGFAELTNIQHDFNTSEWPLADNSMDVIVSSMALHHIATENKPVVMQQIFNTLRPGGVLILSDVYSRHEDRAMFTQNGERGPSECKGYPIAFAEAFDLFETVGFTYDEIAQRAQTNETLIGYSDVEAALEDTACSMPISNSVWFTVLRKEGP